jgi:hypothetical protein
MKYAYYLHKNGDLICKNAICYDDIEGDLVCRKWLIDTDKREDAWRLLFEALHFGCNIDRAKDLITKWDLSRDDSRYAIIHLHSELNDILRDGLRLYVTECLGEDMDEFFIWLQNNPPPNIKTT